MGGGVYMDMLSLYYFSELAKDLHMTRTANRLFISQQTLSNHILRLEEHFEEILPIDVQTFFSANLDPSLFYSK